MMNVTEHRVVLFRVTGKIHPQMPEWVLEILAHICIMTLKPKMILRVKYTNRAEIVNNLKARVQFQFLSKIIHPIVTINLILIMISVTVRHIQLDFVLILNQLTNQIVDRILDLKTLGRTYMTWVLTLMCPHMCHILNYPLPVKCLPTTAHTSHTDRGAPPV